MCVCTHNLITKDQIRIYERTKIGQKFLVNNHVIQVQMRVKLLNDEFLTITPKDRFRKLKYIILNIEKVGVFFFFFY